MSTSVRLSFSALFTALLFAVHAPAQAQAGDATSADPAKAAQLEAVTVTGSRIPRATVEGPSPVTVIDAGDIDAGGYRSVFDVLTAVTQNTGTVQGEDFGSTFTPAANVINLRGLGPNHTLVLVNGRRVADYPVAYNGSVSAVDLANIPSVMIERVEILSGSASAIYGSDAIAGVVNIVLKKKQQGIDLSLKVGGTQQGGGANQRVQISGGGTRGDLSAVFGVELTNREPIRWGDRRLTNSYSRYAPDDLPGALFALRNPATGDYYELPGSGCAGIGHLMNGSLRAYENPRYDGSYCSSDGYYNNRTIQTAKKLATGYASVQYALNDSTELFGDFMFGFSDVENNVRNTTWSAPAGAFWNEATSRLENWSRVLTPEEMGGRNGNNSTYLQRSTNLTFGINGTLGDAGWRYELAANRSDYVSDQGRVRLLAGITDFFLGPRTGSHDYQGSTFAAYNADPARLITPLTTDEFRRLSASSTSRNKAWTEDLSFSFNGDLLELPAGPLGIAGVVETGRQGFRNTPDSRINNGVYWNTSAATLEHGSRNRYAAGFELNAPILSTLTATGAARYDRFSYDGKQIGKSTYNAGLEFRPHETLLLRATRGTSFRAPDMNYLFAQSTLGYFPGVTDYYQCRLQNQPYNSCDVSYNMNFASSGNTGLKPERGNSLSYGFVWSPVADFDLQADYYRIRISDGVTNLDEDQILRTEADCRLGRTPSGTPIDVNSTLCRDAFARVVRTSATAPVNPNTVTNILVNPVNAATERTSGIDISANYRFALDGIGKFQARAAFTRVLEHVYQQFPGDPVRDYLNDLSSQSDWRKKVNASLSWQLGAWSARLDGTRYGEISDNAYVGLRRSYTVYNGSVGYEIGSNSDLLVSVNNLRNSLPVDKSAGWPYYSIGWYDVYGRQWWVQYNYRFGGGRG
ncbi:TonB-dependent receptor-like protein [Tahibacter aquaticus]|uniref:TonB-dependent receptor-like protein n=1 Tax=Tahibacter aquaticus TaxID=520092 RepID=A0A4R6YNX0_9GAMM|nr:TonB-dependent receptor [Tahibacter aquaticus]TDR39411.1 TonB-dependent receptor-like protein [Tahibacter aquaticus]